tara:strand:+ start:590 stop:841 length:252 start_codon:yes stop_codon:yes gene_type:complete
MKNFEITFAKIYPDFTRDLIKSCGALTSTEVRVCMMLKINYSNKEILDQLNISNSTLTNLRSSVRKKMGLKRSQNLSNTLVSL